MTQSVHHVGNTIVRCLEWISAAFLLAMMVLTFVDVIGRYGFNAPIFGSAEMIQFLLMGCIFSAMGIVSARNSHIAVELISPAIAKRFPRSHSWFVGIVSVFGLTLISLQLLRIGLEALRTERVTVVLEWPIAAIAIPCAAFCLLAAILLFVSEGDAS